MSAMDTKHTDRSAGEFSPGVDLRDTGDLRDEADDFEDALLDEMRRQGFSAVC